MQRLANGLPTRAAGKILPDKVNKVVQTISIIIAIVSYVGVPLLF